MRNKSECGCWETIGRNKYKNTFLEIERNEYLRFDLPDDAKEDEAVAVVVVVVAAGTLSAVDDDVAALVVVVVVVLADEYAVAVWLAGVGVVVVVNAGAAAAEAEAAWESVRCCSQSDNPANYSAS